uniref:Condensin-2 complex subunit n=1 Tax=Caenorhabditis tropicalis TaxID=1561998 RepID=A0A1I7UVC6_9PELO
MATTESENELAECLSQPLRSLHDIDDEVATTSADCNYENYEEFTASVDMDFFQQDFRSFLKDLLKKTESVLTSKEKCDVRNVFEESGVATMKFNLFIWHFLENGKRSDSHGDAVQDGVLAASCYVALCSLQGSRADLYQIGLYNLCLKIARNCCHTVRIGETVVARKTGGPKKKANETTAVAPPDAPPPADEPLIGPPRISVDSAEKYLHFLTNQLFAFLLSNGFSIDSTTQMSTLELIEDIGRIELDNRGTSRAYRANSIREFRSLDRFTDRYCAFVHCLIESKYPTRREMAFGRLIRPRLALLPYPDESNKTSKISTERKRAGDLAVALVLSRIARPAPPAELKLIETCLVMVYTQCPDFAEFRTNIAQFVQKILEAMPYGYAYDFVQLMNAMFKGRGCGGGVKSVSNEIANLLLFTFDFGAPDPGPVPDVVVEEEEEEEEEELEEEEDPEEVPEEEEEEEAPRREKKQKKKKKETSSDTVERQEPTSILYNIVYLACIDKSAPMRLHGSHSLAKIIGNPVHRKAFQTFCQKRNEEMEEVEEGEDPPNETNLERTVRGKKLTDMLQNDQMILEKWNRLKKMNKGEERVEKDVVYMIVRRLATDDKAPVKKSACALLRSFLATCDEEVKFETCLSILQKMCRDRMVTVRKQAAEAFTELMLDENIVFKQSLSKNWLNSLISMLNDTDNDVTAQARLLIMRVLTPLLDHPSPLTWTLLNTIESVMTHRNYLMTTLKEAARDRLVHKPVMESMKRHIREAAEGEKTNGAWMVFSQLCVQFGANVDFAVEAFQWMDLSQESDLVKYQVHVIENNIPKIDRDTRKELIRSLKSTFEDVTLHSSHARYVYHCLGKLADGIGEKAEKTAEFREFGELLIVKCVDTIVQSFEMFKDKEEWKRNADAQERLLCTSLHVASEVFSFSPQLIPRHERLAKTLSLIVNSNDILEDVNPDMPSAPVTRPPTQMSLNNRDHEGLMFSEKVRAVSVITLTNMIIQHDRLLKLMPMYVRQLQCNPAHQIRSNIVVSIGDICAAQKTDRYAPMLAASLCDPSVIVRRHAINQIARLISLGIFRFNGEIMIRMMLATLDANEDVRQDAKLFISEVLQSEEANFFPKNFVQYMIALTQARRLVGGGHDEEDRGQVDVAIGRGDPLARPSRIAIYTFMIESLSDRNRFDVKVSICERVFTPIVNGEYDFREQSVQCLLDDALLIMGSSEMQVKMDTGRDPNAETALDEPPAEVMEAAQGFLQHVYLQNYMNTIVPAILRLREFLNHHRSPLQRKCLLAIRMICLEHSKDIDQILQDNRQLKDEMMFELNRVKKRTEEAHQILNDALKKVSEFNRQQQQQQKKASEEEAPGGSGEAEPEDVEMKTPEKKRNPQLDALKTPSTALRSRTEERSTPQSRLLSPKTLKKIRRSVGALIQNEMCLNAPAMEETHVEEERRVSRRLSKEKTIVEQVERMELDDVKEEVQEEEPMEVEAPKEPEEPKNQENQKDSGNPEDPKDPEEQEEDASRRRSRRRKTPNYNDDDDVANNDESIDSEGKRWKNRKSSPNRRKKTSPPPTSLSEEVVVDLVLPMPLIQKSFLLLPLPPRLLLQKPPKRRRRSERGRHHRKKKTKQQQKTSKTCSTRVNSSVASAPHRSADDPQTPVTSLSPSTSRRSLNERR